MRLAMTRFVAAGLGALFVVSGGVWWAARAAAEREAVEDARQRTTTLAGAVIAPALTGRLIRSDEAARSEFDAIIRQRVLGPHVLRVRLWTSEGRIVYSDQPELIGERYDLNSHQVSALRTGQAVAEESDLSARENRLDRGSGPLLEVYAPVPGPGGRTLIFETYQPASTIDARSREVLEQFAPITLAGLGLLLGALVPIAWSLARRLETARAEREAMLGHALEASTAERRRIAAHLHDGMVQSMAGSSYALSGVAETLAGKHQTWAASVVNTAAEELRQNVRALRSLLVEIYPPSLRQAGLGPALSDLTAQLSSRDIEVDLDLQEVPRLPEEIEAALFRVSQEAIHNIVKHAVAAHVHLALARDGDTVVLRIADDGKGFAGSHMNEVDAAASGHIGLSLLRETVREVGGTLSVRSAIGEGTTVTAEVPVP